MWTDLCLKASAQCGLTMYRLVTSSKKLSNTTICEKQAIGRKHKLITGHWKKTYNNNRPLEENIH